MKKDLINPVAPLAATLLAKRAPARENLTAQAVANAVQQAYEGLLLGIERIEQAEKNRKAAEHRKRQQKEDEERQAALKAVNEMVLKRAATRRTHPPQAASARPGLPAASAPATASATASAPPPVPKPPAAPRH